MQKHVRRAKGSKHVHPIAADDKVYQRTVCINVQPDGEHPAACFKSPPSSLRSLSTWPSMASVVQVSTGPTVRSSILRFAARFLIFPSKPA